MKNLKEIKMTTELGKVNFFTKNWKLDISRRGNQKAEYRVYFRENQLAA